MAADVLVTQGARASAAMVLTQNILVSTKAQHIPQINGLKLSSIAQLNISASKKNNNL